MSEPAIPAARAEAGDEDGAAASGVHVLLPTVCSQTKAMTGGRSGQRGATLDTAALVHKLYLRMQKSDKPRFETWARVVSHAARAMCHLPATRARDHLRLRDRSDCARVIGDLPHAWRSVSSPHAFRNAH